MRIVSLGSPFCNAAGRVVFPWARPGDALIVELVLSGAGDGRAVRAEAWTNIDRNDAPWAYSARPMVWVRDDAQGFSHYRVELPVHRVGTYRVAARATLDGDQHFAWSGAQGVPDLVFRPRDPGLDDLRIEVVSVPNVNRCDDGTPGTLADLLGDGAPARDGRYTLRWLAAQGQNAIWLLPVFPCSSLVKVRADDHIGSPYAPVDLFAVRPGLARSARGLTGEAAERAARAEFAAVVDAAHTLGLRVILDLSLNHVGYGFAFRDLFCSVDADGRERRELRRNDFSQFRLSPEQAAHLALALADPTGPRTLEQLAPWLFGCVETFPQGAPAAHRIAPGGWFEWPDARQLNHGRRRIDFHRSEDSQPTTEQQDLRAWLIRVLRFWAVDMRVDGFRIDHLAGLPPALVEQASNLVQADVDRHRPGTRILFIGEDYDTGHVSQHLCDALQADWLGEWLHDPRPDALARIVDSPWFCHLLGLSNHDMDRPLHRLGTDLERTRLMRSVLQLVGGPTLDVVGDDLGEDERLQVRRLERVPALRALSATGVQHAQWMARLRQLRDVEPALHGARRCWLDLVDETARDQVMVFTRHADRRSGRPLLVAANLDPLVDRDVRVRLDVETRRHMGALHAPRWRVLLDAAARETIRPPTTHADGAVLALHLAPLQVLILALVDDEPGAARPRGPTSVKDFACRAEPGRRVELCGDFAQWDQPHRMDEDGPGHYRCALELAPGIYRYRFRVDGSRWQGDDRAAAVDRSEGVDNALCIVGGTAPPLLFAPDARHLRRTGARLTVHLEHAAGEPPPRHAWLHVEDEAAARAAPRPVPLLPVLRTGTHTLLRGEARLDDNERAALGFDPVHGPRFALPDPTGEPGRAPAWARRAVFYGIFLDRWWRGVSSPPEPRSSMRAAPSTATTFYGGDLDGVTEHLDPLVELGVDALVLTPLTPSPSPHRYDATALDVIDPLLGGEPALTRLLETAHGRGLRVVVDVSLTHVNQAHPAFQDLLLHQQRSAFRDWFHVESWPVRPGDATTVRLYPTRPELPMLRLDRGPARAHALDAAMHLVRLGVDGLRLDNMGDAPAEFWTELRRRARALHPELLLLGEVVSDRPHRFAAEAGIDLATDFGHREAMLAFFGRAQLDAARFWQQTEIARFRQGPFDPSFFLLFVDNHDTGRFVTRVGYHDRLRLALCYLLFRPEPVWLTYGTELGMCSDRPAPTLDDAWPDRLPMPGAPPASTRTGALIRELTALRRQLEPWREGDLRLRRAEGQLLVLERQSDRGTLRGYFNAGNAPLVVNDLPAGARRVLRVSDEEHGPDTGLLPARCAEVWWTGGEPPPALIPLPGPVPAGGARATAPREQAPAGHRPRELAEVDRAFRDGRVVDVPLPTRLYVNLTERCNLRCQHCLTCAPARTRDRTGRELDPRVLDALRPHLGHAAYLGFPHAGEPLLAPLLEPLLRALQQARSGQPTVVHLLSNGLALTRERFAALCDLGVNSWSFSVDGLSARTHDALRVGSRIARLLPLLRELSAIRSDRGDDVRLGIAWTVTRHNLDEITALVDFAVDAGLDWVKLEELFAFDPLTQDLAAIEPGQLVAAVEGAHRLARQRDLTLLDHTRTPELYNCTLDNNPALAAFSQGDDQVNRMAINPCRLPWELACVEPDGAIKPVSFDSPIAGHILDEDFINIWNGTVCADARRQAIARRICHTLPLCARDPGPTGW